MGQAVARQYPETAGRVFEAADDLLGFCISKLCFEGTEEQLAQTDITQPALFTTCVAVLMAIQPRMPGPRVAAGHSVGEYAALVAAGAVSFEETLPVVRLRGELMAGAAARTPGAMAAVMGLALYDIEKLCRLAAPEGIVEPSNVNAPSQIVISGETDAVLATMEAVRERGARAVRLKVSAPFHCSLMEPVRQELAPAIEALHIDDPRIPVVANATGGYVRTAAEIRQALIDQITSPVRWAESMQLLLGDDFRSFVEIGPGKVLAGLIRAIDRSTEAISVATPDDIEKLVAE
jgi:[acyl-carrier-protein] S-malonyltransferase